MTLRDELGLIIKKNKWTIADVARILYKDNKYASQTLNNKITNETLRYTEAKKIAEIIGCQLLWIKNDQLSSVNNEESRWNYEDYFGKDMDEVFLHGIKRQAKFRGISHSEMFIKILHDLNAELRTIQNSPD